MTRTIKSRSGNGHYFLTLNQHGEATGCTCADRRWRNRECKHITGYNVELARAVQFQALKNSLDVRSETQQAARRNAYCIEFSIY